MSKEQETLRAYREDIDALDECIARLLQMRFLTSQDIQRVKGRVPRNQRREAEVVTRYQQHLPGMDRPEVESLVDSIITSGLRYRR